VGSSLDISVVYPLPGSGRWISASESSLTVIFLRTEAPSKPSDLPKYIYRTTSWQNIKKFTLAIGYYPKRPMSGQCHFEFSSKRFSWKHDMAMKKPNAPFHAHQNQRRPIGKSGRRLRSSEAPVKKSFTFCFECWLKAAQDRKGTRTIGAIQKAAWIAAARSPSNDEAEELARCSNLAQGIFKTASQGLSDIGDVESYTYDPRFPGMRVSIKSSRLGRSSGAERD
jgi:hypothetical protein